MVSIIIGIVCHMTIGPQRFCHHDVYEAKIGKIGGIVEIEILN